MLSQTWAPGRRNSVNQNAKVHVSVTWMAPWGQSAGVCPSPKAARAHSHPCWYLTSGTAHFGYRDLLFAFIELEVSFWTQASLSTLQAECVLPQHQQDSLLREGRWTFLEGDHLHYTRHLLYVQVQLELDGAIHGDARHLHRERPTHQ